MANEKNTVVEVTVDNLGINGEGVARYNGKAVFIKNVLPGERVRAKIIFSKPSFCHAIVLEYLSKSKGRVAPACPLFPKCGGCNLQHLNYDEQLLYKQDLVKSTLIHVGKIDFPVDSTVASDKVLRYRNKMSLPVREGKNGVEIGLFASASHRVIPCEDCLLQPTWNKVLIDLLKTFIRNNKISCYNEETKKGTLKHFVVREVEGCLYVTLVVTKQIKADAFADMLADKFNSFVLYQNVNTMDNNVILSDKWHVVKKRNEPKLIEGVLANIHPAGFFQVNDYIRRKMYEKVAYVLKNHDTNVVIDAYSGAGILTSFFASFAPIVYGIEINKQAHESATELAKNNGLDNMRPILGDVKDKIGDILDEHIGKNIALVLDPPRSGCDKSVIEKINDYDGITNLVYISCNPATLARDLSLLTSYKILSVTPYDMFPQTVNVETLVILRRKNA